jgi:hypothetical protein
MAEADCVATRAAEWTDFLSVLSWPVPQRERLVGEGPHLDVGPWHTAPAMGIDNHREVGWMAAFDVTLGE